MSVVAFENARWGSGPQTTEFRHRAALSLIPSGSVLDLGCGDGLFLSLLQEHGIVGEGVDASSEAARICEGKGFTTRVQDLSNALPYPDGSFDTVVLLDVLEHVYDPVSLLKEAARIARTRVVVSVPNFSSLPARLQTLFGRVPENNRPNKGHVYWFNYIVLQNIAADAGLHIRSCTMNTLSFLGPIRSLATRFFPNLFALSFVAELHVSHTR